MNIKFTFQNYNSDKEDSFLMYLPDNFKWLTDALNEFSTEIFPKIIKNPNSTIYWTHCGERFPVRLIEPNIIAIGDEFIQNQMKRNRPAVQLDPL